MMTAASYAIYRLPNSRHVTEIICNGNPAAFASCRDLNGKCGFAVAPFNITTGTPVLLLHPDEIKRYALPDENCGAALVVNAEDQDAARDRYAAAFHAFHDELSAGTFRKLVLARSLRLDIEGVIDPHQLFFSACQLYPTQFVALVSTPQSGTWLMATPEVLLSGTGRQWHTVALAGTMRSDDDQAHWSVKNIREQRLVATYVYECLKRFSHDIDHRGPATARAGKLLHLRSDFHFTLPDDTRLGDLLDDLYPTPAVCGLPKDAARQFIIDHEPQPRDYYSGFVGPMGIDGEDTNLYVSLRCMRIHNHSCTLYAGGGLITESEMQSEWEETQAKMQTMLSLMHK